MSSQFLALDTALSALQANQLALDVTGANIANVNTPGYSRQVVNFQSAEPLGIPSSSPTSPGQIGTGVNVASINAVRDQYLNQQVNTANSQLGAVTSLQNIANEVQGLYNEPSSGGLGSTITTFFNDFSTLASNPTSAGDRATVVSDAQAVMSQFQTIASGLDVLQPQIQQQISANVGTVNTDATQIAALNNQIAQSTATGSQPNDLIDQRDALVSQISGLVNVQVTPITNSQSGQDTGAVNLSVGGFALVSGGSANTLPSNVSVDSHGNVAVTDAQGFSYALTSGSIYGLAQATTVVSGAQSNLNTLASTLSSSVNAIQKNGYGLDGSTGVAFFTPDSSSPTAPPVTAQNLTVNPTIANDPSEIAAAAALNPSPAPGQPPFATGNGDNATAIGNLATTPVINGSSITQYYASSVAQIGAEAQTYQSQVTSQTAVVTQLQSQQSSVSGVSLDEELSNQLQYQRAYEAAARIITVQDDVLNTVINTLGTEDL